MTAKTLPGSIPGLLRRGSPVVVPGSDFGSVVGLGGEGAVYVATENTSRWWMCDHLHLDLSDPTGRAHAAWWAVERCGVDALWACGLTLLEWEGIRNAATHGFNMSPASIDALRRVVLHVAGVKP